MGKTVGKVVSLVLLFSLLWGCSTPGNKRPTTGSRVPAAKPAEAPEDIPDAIPVKSPPSSRGNPKSYVVFGKRYYIRDTSEDFRQRGIASWYGPKFHGRTTSSGTPFDMYAMTAAHKSLPLPTYVRVTHLENGRSIVVKVNDRGPFVDDRVIDLSYAAARKLGMVNDGTAQVEITALPPYQYLAKSSPIAPAASSAQDRQAPRLTETAQAVPKPLNPATFGATQSLASRETAEKPMLGAVYLQVGAFAERRNAEQLQHRLANLLRRVIRIDSGAGAIYKVRVGPLKDTAEADLVTTELASLGIGKPHLVFE